MERPTRAIEWGHLSIIECTRRQGGLFLDVLEWEAQWGQGMPLLRPRSSGVEIDRNQGKTGDHQCTRQIEAKEKRRRQGILRRILMDRLMEDMDMTCKLQCNQTLKEKRGQRHTLYLRQDMDRKVHPITATTISQITFHFTKNPTEPGIANSAVMFILHIAILKPYGHPLPAVHHQAISLIHI